MVVQIHKMTLNHQKVLKQGILYNIKINKIIKFLYFIGNLEKVDEKIMALLLRRSRTLLSTFLSKQVCSIQSLHTSTRLKISDKILEEKTPFGKISDAAKSTEKVSEDPEADAYAPFPDATNPETGEIGGPLGPEPTRYGDWERKGRCSDF